MAQTPQPIRFVERNAPRATRIPPEKWNEHKEELCTLRRSMNLHELMALMKERHGFEPSPRQYIFQFGKWGIKKYNTSGRDTLPSPLPDPSPSQPPLSTSAPERSISVYPAAKTAVPKRPKSLGSLRSCDGTRSSMDGRPNVPHKKRLKLAQYLESRESLDDPFADPLPNTSLPVPVPQAPDSRSRRPPPPPKPASLSRRPPVSPVHQLASLALQFASTGQPGPSTSPPVSNSPYNLHSSGTDAGTNAFSNTPDLIEDDSDWMINYDYSDSDRLLLDNFNSVKMANGKSALDSSSTRRRFDSSRPIHTFSLEELADMKMAAHFLRALGFESDAFELFTILLKQLKEPSTQPAWMKSSALINCVRSAYWSPQMDIARNELSKTLDEPRDASTDAEHFLYRMLFAETYTRSHDKENEDFYSETAIGCELASDKMFDKLPSDHRGYDILMYHYLNKCLEYLNVFVKDSADEGTVFTDKEHLQIRLVERIPGPFELRRGRMGNPCLRSCLMWCSKQLYTLLPLPESWKDLQSNDRNYIYWTDHIGLYCTLWERWHAHRRDLSVPLEEWMGQTEVRMGITPAELLSVVCGLIMAVAPPRIPKGATLIARARKGLQAVSCLTDKELSCQFLDTFSLLGTLLGSAPQRQYHDPVSLFAALMNSTREREAFGDRARAFSRAFIEHDLNMVLPVVQRDTEPPTNQPTATLSTILSDSAMQSIGDFISPFLASSIHSSELCAMRSLRDQIEQAARRSMDRVTVAPSTVGKMASRSYVSIPTVSELSQAMASTLSLSSSQERANSALDTLAASSKDLMELFVGVEGNFFDPDSW